MADLSPQAQAVLDAIEQDGTVIHGMPLLRPLIAAALRAAAVYSYCPVDRQRLFAIAAELENNG